jgi:AcrR family transcriptional regulator
MAAHPDRLGLDAAILARELELYENPLTAKQRDILQAAEKLFSDQGFAATSTAAIAREAGVTEKTLFKHFPTKVDLFRRILFPLILRTLVPVQLQIVKRVLEGEHASWREMIEKLAVDRFATARLLGPRLKLVLTELIQNDRFRAQAFRLLEESMWPSLVAAIERFQRSGELRSDMPAEEIARAQVALIAGQALRRAILAPEKTYDDDADARRLVALLYEGVRAR